MNPDLALGRVYTEFADFGRMRVAAREESPEALRAVAKEFEALFLQMMLKSMRDAELAGDDLMGSDQLRMYQDLFDRQIALDLGARGELGIAELLVRQLSPAAGPEEGEDRELKLGSRGDPSLMAPPWSMATVPRVPSRTQAEPGIAAAGPRAPVGAPSRLQFHSPADFVIALEPYAAAAARELGTSPEVLLAQAALETGWGQRMIHRADGRPSHNLFGIKADARWQGPRVAVGSIEYEDGFAVRRVSAFRVYDSFGESFRDYVRFLRDNPRYGLALRQAEDPAAYIRGLQRAGYATDPQYANKVLDIMRRNVMAELKFTADGPL